MLEVKKGSKTIRVETGTAVFEWDVEKGAQLTRCDLKCQGELRNILKDAAGAPNLALDVEGRTLYANAAPAEITYGREDDQCFAFSARSRLGDLFTLEQEYEVYREGVVFCEFNIILDDGRKVAVENARMDFQLDLDAAKNIRVNYKARDTYLKQDVTCTHVLSTVNSGKEKNKRVEANHLLPLYGLDLGWEESRYFSNRVEFVLEDSTSIGGDMLEETGTVAGKDRSSWRLTWRLKEKKPSVLKAPFLYRNKWALFCASARDEAGADADPGRRNNLLGAKICHMMYPYVYGSQDWPWCSVPTKQTFYQDVQLASDPPSLDRVGEAADLGANVLVIHQFWMKNGGSNGEPMADYRPHDPEWFKAVIDRAHERGMRVAVYMRGVEQYCMYFDFFEKYLKKDYDGLYVDWATPFAHGFAKSSIKHSSVYNWFMFTRALRERVGENGFLIGHSTMQTAASYAAFDATITGEFSVLHSGLLSTPETSSSYAGAGCVGVHLIAGNSPDRSLFSSQRAAGFSVGLGYSNHPFMEPDKPFGECNAYIQPLWDMLSSLKGSPVKVYNPATGASKPFGWTHEALHPIAYQTEDKETLVMVANLSDITVNGDVTVDFPAMGLEESTDMAPLEIEHAHVAEVEGSTIRIKDMKPYGFCGLKTK
ncbi:MAG: hypothetical protein ABFR33_05580 [Verrucomicrobiota bacterium]